MKTHNEKTHDILVKDKKVKAPISFLWFNLFGCLMTGLAAFMMLHIFTNLPLHGNLTIAIFFYIFDVKNQSTEHYLQYQIDNLKDKAYYDNMFNDEKFELLQAEINELKKK